MIELRRELTAERINNTLNHPEVRPWVSDVPADRSIDVSRIVSNRDNVVLTGDHGGCIFVQLQPGVYEAHMHVLPQARGAWSSAFVNSLLRWMFTKTNAFDIVTRIPQGHVAARVSALGHGMRHEFVRPAGALFRGKRADVNMHSIRVQDWVAIAPDLASSGSWFHEGLTEEARRIGLIEPPHEDDENHNRYVGACVQMALGGQLKKGINLYNRWALLSRQKTISFVSADPPTVKIDIGMVRIVDGRVEILSSC